ncbi:hypothetical protein WR25_06958 [Diploscapter pachys]|uniref:Uncharacterized protein n=1 Tax=Diploscapter pachys TaxID=2018661 RepID=A0A2A2K3R4_9BILA|nr:hypothetical protein WR25_06958 [Diploscapter pachys]
MLKRLRKLPPSASLTVLSASRSSVPFSPVRCAPTTIDCGLSGRSTSTMRGVSDGCAPPNVLVPGVPMPCQSPKRASSAAFTSPSGRSETTKIFALSGRSHACSKRRRSAGVSDATATGSPEPCALA